MGFLKADYVDIVLVVFSEFELVPLIEEIVEFSAVDFVEGEAGFEVTKMGLDIREYTLARY